MKLGFKDIYKRLFARFGPQYWWPADSAFEVMIGAILTQNTSWTNVEKAIRSLKKNKVLSPAKLYGLCDKRLAQFIRPSGYYNLKALRIKNFLAFFIRDYKASVKRMAAVRTSILREQLLSVKGIGPETADSILLYALAKPVFVVDAYTKRIFSRHKIIAADPEYHSVQGIFMRNLPADVGLFKEYHALIVRLAKEFCFKNNPKCRICPLKENDRIRDKS
ncbi:MAG: endonuclease III domain-containing protein [Candidatus Omnitrophica bacterium]|jgi:endonuclease-3 related protein|nr:endonuclease III domain-containing protein [Candidatus Omnitrophota bacterium]MDD5079979.1 endonuclease III domain-containing protein [Candidatus Omnitrophota bacterium]